MCGVVEGQGGGLGTVYDVGELEGRTGESVWLCPKWQCGDKRLTSPGGAPSMKAEMAATLSDAMTVWEKVKRKVAYVALGGTRGGLDNGLWLLSGSGDLGQSKTCAD